MEIFLSWIRIIGVFQGGFHPLRIGDEVGGEVAAVELHPFDGLQGGFHRLGFLDGDDPFLADFLHGLGDDVADGLVVVGGDGADLGDLLVVLDRLGDVLQFGYQGFHGLVEAALDLHRVVAGGYQFGTLTVDRLGQHGSGGGAVAGHVGGLGGDFFHQLGAHVLELVVQFDFLGDGYAVLGDEGRAERFLDDDVAAFGAEGYLDGVCQCIDTFKDGISAFLVELDEFSCHCLYILLG